MYIQRRFIYYFIVQNVRDYLIHFRIKHCKLIAYKNMKIVIQQLIILIGILEPLTYIKRSGNGERRQMKKYINPIYIKYKMICR